jgi:hypothetical protein
MISSRNARTVANLAIASALTILLAACSSMSLPSLSSSSAPEAEPVVAPEVPATIRADEIVGRWGLASFQNPGHPAGTAPQGQPERQELYRPGRPDSRRTGSRNRLVRRSRARDPFHRKGCRGPLRQHGLCPLRAAGVRLPLPSCHAKAGHPVTAASRLNR